MLSLLEDRWDDLMTLDPQLFGQAGGSTFLYIRPQPEIQYKEYHAQEHSSKKLEQIQNQESESHLMGSVYELRSCQQYLRVNSENP